METSYSGASPARAARGYGHVHRSALIEGASPHELVRLMLDGAVASLGAAASLDPGTASDRDARRRAIGRALGFVQELQGSLREPGADELAGRLFSVYGFVIAQLLETNVDGDADKLADARDALTPIAEAWAAIAPAAASPDDDELPVPPERIPGAPGGTPARDGAPAASGPAASQRHHLERLVALTRDALGAVEAGDADALAALDERRRDAVRSLRGGGAPDPDCAALAREARALDARLLERTVRARDELGAKVRALHAEDRARRGYAATASLGAPAPWT